MDENVSKTMRIAIVKRKFKNWDEAQMPGRSFHWKRLCLPRVFKGFGWTCIKNHWFFKVFELSIILDKILANINGFSTFFLKNIKTPRFWTFFLHEAQMPWRSFHWKRLFLPRVFKGFGWTCIKNHSFYKVFELCIILGKNLANTKGFGTCFWKIFKKHVGFGRPS